MAAVTASMSNGSTATLRKAVLKLNQNFVVPKLNFLSILSENGCDEIIRLNVGGQGFRLLRSSICIFAGGSRLAEFALMEHEGRLASCNGWFDESNEYFFNRPALYFSAICDFLMTGELHCISGCSERFSTELNFWQITPASVPACCEMRFEDEPEPEGEKLPEDKFKGKFLAGIRRSIWSVTDGDSQQQSNLWQKFAIFSNSIVIISLLCMIASTVPEFRVSQRFAGFSKTRGNFTVESAESHLITHPFLSAIEALCMVYFSIEYVGRLLVSPEKCSFVKDPLNLIDLVAIFPFLVEQTLSLLRMDLETVKSVRWLFVMTRLLRVLRVVRVAKLGRRSPGMRTFAQTMQRSQAQLKMVLGVFIAAVVFFSSLVYFFEENVPQSTFDSIPSAMWWCIVTMTTVGYGDMVPATIVGKMIGSMAIVGGVMVLALPITIIVNNFVHVAKLNN